MQGPSFIAILQGNLDPVPGPSFLAILLGNLDAAYCREQRELHQGHAKAHVAALLSLARQRFKVKYKLMTTDAVYDKEVLIASHLHRLEQARQHVA